jgi:hypothetical protein
MSPESQNQSDRMIANRMFQSELRVIRSAMILFFSHSNNSTAS